MKVFLFFFYFLLRFFSCDNQSGLFDFAPVDSEDDANAASMLGALQSLVSFSVMEATIFPTFLQL